MAPIAVGAVVPPSTGFSPKRNNSEKQNPLALTSTATHSGMPAGASASTNTPLPNKDEKQAIESHAVATSSSTMSSNVLDVKHGVTGKSAKGTFLFSILYTTVAQ